MVITETTVLELRKGDIEEYPGLSGLFNGGRGRTTGNKRRNNTDVGKIRRNSTSAEEKWKAFLFRKGVEAAAFRSKSVKRRIKCTSYDLLFTSLPLLENS